jgi:CRP-like cAMP-binding protein
MVSKEVKDELASMMERVNTTEREVSQEVVSSHGFKYASKWRSAHNKLKSRFMLKSLMKDLNLYGTSQDYMDELELYLTEAKFRKNTTIYNLVEENEEPKNPWVIYPTSSFKSIWNVCLIMLLLYTATLMPYRISFTDKTGRDGWWYWDLVLDFGFCIDIVVNCFSAYVDSEGQVVANNRLILWNYTKSWLLIDVIAVFPFDLFNENQDQSRSKSGYNNLIRLVRLPRLYRLVRISRVIKAFSEVNQSEWVEKLQEMIRIKASIMRLLTSFLTVLVCLHIMACFWYFAAKLNDIGPDTWVFRFGYLDASEGRLYLASLYWALTTLATVGYGDITPGTNIEKCLAMAWMLFGMIFFSFTIGSLTSMLSGIDTKETVLSNKLSIVDEFAKESHLSKAIQKRLRSALRYSTDKQGFSWADKIGIFNELPRKLRYEVALVMHKGAVKNFPFFANKDPVFISSTVPFLQSIMIPEGEFIFKEGEYADEIYFLVRGRAALVTADGKVPYKSLQANSYFGEIEMIKQVPRRYSSMALVECDLLTLSRQMVNLIKEEFPGIWTEMVEVAEHRDKLNAHTKRALRHLQMLKRTGQIEGMNQEQIKESVDAYAKASEPFEVEEPNEEKELESLNSFITDIEIQISEAAEAVHVLLQKLNSQSTPMSR